MAATKKAATKKGGSKKAGGKVVEGDFTSGAENENIRPDPAETKPKRAQAQDLPGMEDRRIAELHTAAQEYVRIRDARMQLNAEEIDLKAKLKGLMKKHKKEEYNCEGVEIRIVHIDEEDVKVKVAKVAD